MSLRDYLFLIVLLVATLISGYLLSWWLTGGIAIGAAITIYIYQRRYDVIDGIESEIGWWQSRHERAESGEYDD